MNKKKVLLIGGGGREHAIAYKLKQSPLLGELKVYPGNGGFAEAEIIQEKPDLKNRALFQEFVKKEKFDLVVVGPEDPLVDGMADWMAEIGIPCFGPSAYCARIEGSKDFAKNLMTAAGVPTAAYATFTDHAGAAEYIRQAGVPIVVKADGLAAGKGVTVALTMDDAMTALDEIFLSQSFGKMDRVVIEEFMDGEEASVFALCDGENFVTLPAAQDHKRVFDGDKGPNTGGMGAYCPAPVVTPAVAEKISRQAIAPVLEYFKKTGNPYKGLLYAGLMIKDGEPRVVEYNCRFGDPETQAVLLLLEDDLLELMEQCALGALTTKQLKIKNAASVVVVVAAEGYPGSYKKNIPLAIPADAGQDIVVFHAGTGLLSGSLVSTGGRILGVSSVGADLKDSVGKVYKYLSRAEIPGTFFRKDIAWRAL